MQNGVSFSVSIIISQSYTLLKGTVALLLEIFTNLLVLPILPFWKWNKLVLGFLSFKSMILDFCLVISVTSVRKMCFFLVSNTTKQFGIGICENHEKWWLILICIHIIQVLYLKGMKQVYEIPTLVTSANILIWCVQEHPYKQMCINSFNRSCTVSSLRFTGSCPDFKTRIR